MHRIASTDLLRLVSISFLPTNDQKLGPNPELLSALAGITGRSEGFPLAAYLVPGRDGMGVWPNSKIVQAGASSNYKTSLQL